MNAYVIIKKGIPKTIKEKCYDVMLRGGKQNVKLHINRFKHFKNEECILYR